MRLRIIKIGRVAYPALRELTKVYVDRLRSRAEHVELKDDAAALRLLTSGSPGELVVMLDERGEQWDSPGLSQKIATWRDDPTIKGVSFVIGGPMGLSPELKRLARVTWSLTRLTMTSDMAWLLCWEQVYRAHSILDGSSYHHA